MKRFTTSVPVFSSQLTDKTRDAFLAELKRAKADRVFFCVDRWFDKNKLELECKGLRKNIEYLNSNGIEGAIWLGASVGHGLPLMYDGPDASRAAYTRLTFLHGGTEYDSFCPLDEDFSDVIADNVREYAKCGAKTILIDDDFRLSFRGNDLSCFCDLHLAEMSKLLGEDVTREMLQEHIVSGSANKYRDAWLTVQKKAIFSLAKKMRAAADSVDPSIRLANCSSFSSWGTDGFLAPELSRLLAGNNRPLMRLFGAPYWFPEGSTPLPGIFETVRNHDKLTKHEGIERMCEGDVYPRPRQNCPASYLMLYDAFVRSACSLDGILCYMLDYTSSPAYENGYIDRYERILPLNERLRELFSAGECVGVRVYEFADKYRTADLSVYKNVPGIRDMCKMSLPKGASMLARSSIPTTYEGEGICPIVCGENARYIEPSVLSRGAILDGLSAKILFEAGVDVGLEEAGKFSEKVIPFELYPDYDEKIMIFDGKAQMLDAKIKPEAKILSRALDNTPTAYAYENKDGKRFLVFTFDLLTLSRFSSLCNSYTRQRQLREYIEWISGKKLPAFSAKCPDLYILCKKDNDGMTVGLFNCFADDVYMAKVELNEAYAAAEFIGCTGSLDGDIATVDSIPPFGYAALRLKK